MKLHAIVSETIADLDISHSAITIYKLKDLSMNKAIDTNGLLIPLIDTGSGGSVINEKWSTFVTSLKY